jgi:uncharacterized protein
VIFIHGGGYGAHRLDAEIARRLSRALGPKISMGYPHIPGLEDLDWAATSRQLSRELGSNSSAVVAHSVGGAAVLKLLSSASYGSIDNLFLLAPPYKAEDSHWGIDEFTFPNNFADRLGKRLRVTIYHSDDDNIIPVMDALVYQRKLRSAKVSLLRGYGHQFIGSLHFLAADIRCAVKVAAAGNSRPA